MAGWPESGQQAGDPSRVKRVWIWENYAFNGSARALHAEPRRLQYTWIFPAKTRQHCWLSLLLFHREMENCHAELSEFYGRGTFCYTFCTRRLLPAGIWAQAKDCVTIIFSAAPDSGRRRRRRNNGILTINASPWATQSPRPGGDS